MLRQQTEKALPYLMPGLYWCLACSSFFHLYHHRGYVKSHYRMIGSEYCRFWRARLGFPTSKSQSHSPILYSCSFSLLCSPSSPSPSISGWKLISSLIWKSVLMRSTSSLYFIIAFPHPLHLTLLLTHRLHFSCGICLLHVWP